MDIKVSIIIPVYNIGEELAKCIDFALFQTMSEIEVLCISMSDDERSLNLLKHYRDFDERIKIIEQNKFNLSFARNIGVREAQGEYVLFLNPNDNLSSLAAELLYNNAKKNNSDVVLFDFVWKNSLNCGYINTGIKDFKGYYTDTPFSIEKMGSLSFKMMPVPVWTKLYRREFLLKETKLFEDNRFAEIPFWGEVYNKAQRITYVTEPLYFYDLPKDTLNFELPDENAFDIIEAYEHLKKIFKKCGHFKQYKESIFGLMMGDLLSKFSLVSPNLKEKYFSKMKSMNKDINYKIYESDSYSDNERRAAKLFESMKKDDYKTFVNRLLGGLNG